mmetsp:Transcript_14741/g.37492  ORF Transcript_14741/g.37492 Transcript_14741/m.37492 type:complete len:223 (+) Transcript_14741:87-755(+)|eukprot:CAMPEP_0177659668 /NCGR_PEP_ID=MMETSP0447-20121125/17574_1 /TAXON_ID=0 /ORGANISM="Stygamoeba regulata, Strain BSH-02190019" /LENGTH=222 /DNA_ID=CAMNT_0019164571 /DNA_START=62 /DNA_END=730 /DNA_ORIENTATION=+
MGQCFGKKSEPVQTPQDRDREPRHEREVAAPAKSRESKSPKSTKPSVADQAKKSTKSEPKEGGRDVDAEERLHQETDELYQKHEAIIKQHADERARCFDESQKAFKAGDKARAKELSDQGKAAGAAMEKAREEQGAALFRMRNSKLEKNTIDLHGLQLEFAMRKVESFLDKQAKPGAELLIITGAGNHSADKAKIKPAVHKTLKERKLKYEEVNNGSVKVSC